MPNFTCAELLSLADAAGVTLAVDGEQLTVTGPAYAANLGRELVQRKAEVIAHLTWDSPAAITAMSDADSEVERCGCVGAHPLVQAAVLKLATAYSAHDLPAVRTAAEEVKAAARQVAVGVRGAT